MTEAREAFRITPDEPVFVSYDDNDDLWRAIALLEPLAGKGNNDADYLLGVAYMKFQRWRRALPLLQALADADDPRAYYPLGAAYHMGEDHETAVLWFEKAARHGMARANAHLAVLYVQGLGNQAQIDMIPTMLEQVSTIPSLRPMADDAKQVIKFELERRNGPTERSEIPSQGCVFYVSDTIYTDQESSVWCDSDEIVESAALAVNEFVKEGRRRKDGRVFLSSLGFRLRGTYRSDSSRQYLEGTMSQGGAFGFRVVWKEQAWFNTSDGFRATYQ